MGQLACPDALNIYYKGVLCALYLTCRNPRKISTIQSKYIATIRPTGYVYAYPNCALAKAMAHDGCILHIGVGSLIVARLDNAGRSLGASNRQTSDRMRLPLFVYMVRTITKNKSQNSEPQRTYRRHVFWTYPIHFSIILRI